MGKKKLIFNIILLLSICSINCYAQVDKNSIPFNFSNKEEILKWSEGEFGYKSYIGDTLSINIEYIDIFVLFACYSSGPYMNTLFMFINNNFETEELKTEENWRLFCMRDTRARHVRVEFEEIQKNIIVKNEDDILLIIPFEVLKSKY